MLSKENLESLLTSLQFSRDSAGKVWRREFPFGCALEVDIASERFLYEKTGITVTGATTANFSQKENFVVFECVCRLLEKGYRPKDIELEPTWKLGHTDKGGRADIWIRTKTRNKPTDSLLIIECKTPGREFDGAWRDTREDGAQLFSYYQQEASTKYLCLYSSDLSAEGKLTCDYRLIRVEDNPDYLKTLKRPRTFAAATTARDRFAVWRDTYRLDSASKGLFEPEIAPYKPGKTKYSTADLVEIDHASMQKKYNEFATILRQYNVSGHENAFDKLVNLFLAKVVDETENPQDLKFYWKGIAYDDAFSLQDRLQYLYMVGMKKFLGETVTYIDEAQVKKAFRRFENDPDATKDAILDYFRKLKFYTNNDFSFIDVHNERLFKENFAVLLAIVRMLEDIKLKTAEPNQFLGDLFEGFLDNGVKQSEGQFFTPLPIVRFIISSLPLQDIVRGSAEPPRVIDYACGAGHFLNEYAQQAKPFIQAYFPECEKTYYSAITGIEKEYRLSKVAKVAAFMYGEDDIKIIYADALAKNPDVPEETFDILVANPPYSVDGFLQTLSEEDRGRYELMACKPDLAKLDAIQTFFVERAVQLLKPTGIAAVILPSSILSNSGNVYVKCREIILENFDIVAIAEFGSGTFGATVTNTATFFLRKKDSPPDFATHWKNRADVWFAAKHDGDEVFGDSAALERYCAHREFDLAGYKDFLAGKSNALGLDRDAEREKLAFFLMADANPVPVLVIKMPTETKAAKAFLGYEWSKRKGNEGIKYLGAGNAENELERNKGIAAIKTPLFDNAHLDDATAPKLNSLVRQNFRGALDTIPDELKPYAKQVHLADMLDFEVVTFDKQFKTSATVKLDVSSKYPIVALREVCSAINPSKAEIKLSPDSWVSFVPMESVSDEGYIASKVDRKLSEVKGGSYTYFAEGDIIIAKITPCMENGKCALAKGLTNKVAFGSSEFHVFRANEQVLPTFLFIYLNQPLVRKAAESNMTGASGHRRVPISFYEMLSMPVPPLAVQRKIVAECGKVDEEYNTSRMTVEEYRGKISKIFEKFDISAKIRGGVIRTLAELLVNIQGPKTKIAENQIMESGKIPVITQESDRMIAGYTSEKEAITDLPLIVFGDHTCTFKYVDFPFVRGADGTQLLKTDENKVLMRYLCGYLQTREIERAGKYERHFKYLKQMKIPVPPIEEQKRIVSELEKYEAKIAQAQAFMASVPARKQEILKKYGVIV